jgi:nucleoid DNA-binding protein
MADGKRLTKAQVFADIAERTGLEKKDVQSVFTALMDLIERELGAEGPGEVILPDLVKLKVKVTDARPEHVGKDPFSGDQRTFPAKPASRKVKATALKPLKDRVA